VQIANPVLSEIACLHQVPSALSRVRGEPREYSSYFISFATVENTLFAFPPIKRIVPMTMMRITASITAYSAMSWPSSLDHRCKVNIGTVSFVSMHLRKSHLGAELHLRQLSCDLPVRSYIRAHIESFLLIGSLT
jgi:hypothetical protein